MLHGKRVAIVVANEFDERELEQPYNRLLKEGVAVTIVGVEANQTLISHYRQEEIKTDASFEDISADDYDAVIIPGGYSPDKLRLSQRAVDFVRSIHDKGGLVAAICHGPSLLISADLVKDKTITGWPSIIIDLKNAGANVTDAKVAIDGNIVTARSVSDLPAFIHAILNMLDGKSRIVAAS